MISDNETIRRKQRNFVRKNLQAIVVLNTAFSKYPQYLTLIRNNRATEWPSGRAWFIMETLRQKFLPRDGLTHFHDHSDFNIHIDDELFRLGEADVLVSNANVNIDVYGEYENEPAEDNITIMSFSNEEAARSINHPSCDTSLGPLDHSSSTNDLSVSVFPYPFNEATGMSDFHDAVSYQPFQYPDCEYFVPPTGPIS